MKLIALFALAAIATGTVRADAVSELNAVERRYNLDQVARDELVREKYVLELAKLRWSLARRGDPGWKMVDVEVAAHPMLSAETEKLQKIAPGIWHSPRHDYLFRADGTWVMDPDEGIQDATHGFWAVKGNQYTEDFGTTTSNIILLDSKYFITASHDGSFVNYETRSLDSLPLRRD